MRLWCWLFCKLPPASARVCPADYLPLTSPPNCPAPRPPSRSHLCRLMKLHKVSMDETHAVIMLRMCYNRLRQTWVPGGYPPHRPDGPAAGSGAGSALPGMRRTHERQRLLEVR